MTEEPIAPLPTEPASPASLSEPPSATAASSKSAPPVHKRSRLHLPLISMIAVVGLVAIAATHRFWWPLVPQMLATVGGKPTPVSDTNEPPAAAPSATDAQTSTDQTAPPPGAEPPVDSSAPSPSPSSNDVQELRREIDELKQRPVVDPQTVAALNDTIHQFDDRLRGVEARLDQKETQIRAERALMLAAGEISQDLGNSSSYEAPFAVIKSVVGDDPALTDSLATLGRTAKTGVPSRWALSQRLTELSDQIAQPDPDDGTRNFWDRTIARVSNLVSIRRERDSDNPTAPLSPQALIAGAQRALVAGDLNAAIQQIQQIQGVDAARVKPWLDLAASRQAAEQAAEALQESLTQRLADSGKTP